MKDNFEVRFAIANILKECSDYMTLSDNDKKWRTTKIFERINDNARKGIGNVSSFDGELTSYIANFGGNFHTMLRKCYDNSSSYLLYEVINNNGYVWDVFLLHLDHIAGDDDPIELMLSALNDLGGKNITGYRDMFIAMDLFFKENFVDDVQETYKEFTGQS